MAISEDDVRHVAALARLGLEPDRVTLLARELNGILAHMEAIAAVEARQGIVDAGLPRGGMWLRPDEGPQLPLAAPRESLAPEMRDGFFLVPRLATHEDAEEGA